MTELSPRALADVVVDAAGDKKAEDILVLNVSELTTIAVMRRPLRRTNGVGAMAGRG